MLNAPHMSPVHFLWPYSFWVISYKQNILTEVRINFNSNGELMSALWTSFLSRSMNFNLKLCFFSILIMHFKLHFTPIFNLIEIDYKLPRNSSAVCIFKIAYIFKLHRDNGFFPKKMVITYSGWKQLKSFYMNTSYAANNVIDQYVWNMDITGFRFSKRST